MFFIEVSLRVSRSSQMRPLKVSSDTQLLSTIIVVCTYVRLPRVWGNPNLASDSNYETPLLQIRSREWKW
jgi:hypothetical protein